MTSRHPTAPGEDWSANVTRELRAEAFTAYSTFSVLGNRFLNVEHAVRTVLQQVNVEQIVADQVRARSQAEGMPLPPELWQRIEYLFVADRD